MRLRDLVVLSLFCSPLTTYASKPPVRRTVAQLQKAKQSRLIRIELGKMSARKAGSSHATLEKFIANRDALKASRFAPFVELAAGLLAKIPAKLVDPTMKQAEALFAAMKKANIGTIVPDDFCYARAELAARAAQRAGFNVRKVNFVAADGTKLKVQTKNTLTGEQEWSYHVAPVVSIGGKDYVIDPSLDSKLVTVEEWEAKMNNPKGKTVITPANQWSYESPLRTDVKSQVDVFAQSLWIVAGVREYEQFRLMDLASQANR